MADVGKTADTRLEQTALQEMQDQRSFTRFRHAQLAPFFNDKACAEPATAENSRALAALFTDSLAAFDKSTAGQPLSATENNTLVAAILTAYNLRQSSALGDDLDRYAAARLDGFIAEDPDRWRRIQKNSPGLTAPVTQYRPAG